jgi:hypothetical protein
METSDSISGQLIIMIGLVSVTFYPILQFFALKRMQGDWRLIAFLPLLLMAVVFFVTVVALYQQANLWPIILIFASPLSLVYLLFLMIIHLFAVRGENG